MVVVLGSSVQEPLEGACSVHDVVAVAACVHVVVSGSTVAHVSPLAMMPVASQKRSILDRPRQLDLDLSRTDRCCVCVDCVAGDCDAETKRETEAAEAYGKHRDARHTT